MASTLPAAVQTLIERYAENRDTYESGSYNETQTRRDFIDPLFMALGWDVDNSEGYSEAYRDVIHEDAIKVGGSTKAPDYSFRIGKERKFFVEAKKPGVNIKTDKVPAYQLRRYAWSTKLPLSILTDFQEWAIYDGRIKPSQTDAPSKARIDYFTFEQLEEKWDFLVSTFSKEAILKGAFDKYAQGSKNKRGTGEVDSAFLQEIEQWRELLAKNIAKNNAQLSQRELNFAVQRTIDRIVFLRICEDRGVERHGELLGISGGTRLYPRLVERFHRADERYNSGLFHFTPEPGRTDPPDDLTPELIIDDKPLKDILAKLYYPECPYEFSVLPADILGQVYEQFLGKTIRLTKSHRAVVEEKPEVRKAGGVYYTPTYIVDYIVQHTVGKLVEGKTPQQVGAMTTTYKPSKARTAQPITVLDPACGSGSFLLGAYQFLLDWYTEQYINDGPAKHTKGAEPRLCQHSSGEYRLTTSERKRILLTHIYGVDIDSQAVETTKLSLLLKVLEGETTESIDSQMKMFHTRALPDLSCNIKCGNSLIAPDFYQGQQHTLFDFDEEEQIKINVFDWNEEFKNIMQSGGFDAVIGNPPWGADLDNYTTYYERHFPRTTKGFKDTYKLFFDKTLQLSSQVGLVGMITPSSFVYQPRYEDVKELLGNYDAYTINLGEKIFDKVEMPCGITLVEKESAGGISGLDVINCAAMERPGLPELLSSIDIATARNTARLQSQIRKDTGVVFDDVLLMKDAGINYQRVNVGLSEKGKSDLGQRLLYVGERRGTDPEYWKGEDIGRYNRKSATNRFVDTSVSLKLRPNERVILNREYFSISKDKLLWRQTADSPVAVIDDKGIWFGRSVQAGLLAPGCDSDIRCVLGVMNSRYIEYLYKQKVLESGRLFPQVKLKYLKPLPFPSLDLSTKADRAMHDQLVSLVEQMLELHKRLPEASGQGRTLIERNIAATDKQIDQLVYQLYGLSEEEIELVESSLAE